MIKNNSELRGALHMIESRIDVANSADEWRVVATHASDIAVYAKKCEAMARRAEVHAKDVLHGRLHRLDGEFHSAQAIAQAITLAELLKDNEFSHEDEMALRRLQVGESHTLGGGAGAEATITRLT